MDLFSIEGGMCSYDNETNGDEEVPLRSYALCVTKNQTHFLSWTLNFESMGEHIELLHLIYIGLGYFTCMV